MILALSKQLFQLDHNIRIGKYGFKYLDKKLYRPQGQTVGLVGFGKIPSTLAKQVQCSLDMKVIAYDPYITEEAAAKAGVRKVDLETLMKESDFVSIHVPLTDDTRYMIDEKMLRLMKPTAYLVNAGRGAIVKEADLVKVLKDRAIAGAAIDVFEIEPIQPNDPLLELDNVFVTPHSAWYNEDSRFDLQAGAAENVARILSGGEPVNAVNLKLIQEYKSAK
ncbi:Glyoxylate/hydroxypyruvate reductase B [bioreactor metagenome]|uniref:Glyoxylate/hydroxypyruvate reductase B n=1 Tax=bioreactor metagenome TaxID=1076179 RepID=A0A645DB80_9ZZZZ